MVSGRRWMIRWLLRLLRRLRRLRLRLRRLRRLRLRRLRRRRRVLTVIACVKAMAVGAAGEPLHQPLGEADPEGSKRCRLVALRAGQRRLPWPGRFRVGQAR